MTILHEPDGNHVRISADMQRALKALGTDPSHEAAVHFLIYSICGRHRMSFSAGLPQSNETTAWLEGRRYVGETLARIIERPITEDPVPPQPRPRTMTESVRRRNTAATQG